TMSSRKLFLMSHDLAAQVCSGHFYCWLVLLQFYIAFLLGSLHRFLSLSLRIDPLYPIHISGPGRTPFVRRCLFAASTQHNTTQTRGGDEYGNGKLIAMLETSP